MALRITTTNVHDRQPLAALAADLQGKMFGDKGLHLQGDDATALAARAPLDHQHSPQYEESPHAPAGQAVAAQALQD